MEVTKDKLVRWLSMAYLAAMALWAVVTTAGGNIFYTGMTNINASEGYYHGTYPDDVVYYNGSWYVEKPFDSVALTLASIAAALAVCFVLALLVKYCVTSKRRATFAIIGVCLFTVVHLPLLYLPEVYSTMGFNWNMLLYMTTAAAAYPALVTVLAMFSSYKPVTLMWHAGAIIVVVAAFMYLMSGRYVGPDEFFGTLLLLLCICGCTYWMYSKIFESHIDDLLVVNWYGALFFFTAIRLVFLSRIEYFSPFDIGSYFLEVVIMSGIQAWLCLKDKPVDAIVDYEQNL